VLDDERTPQLSLALPVGVPGPDLVEALRRDARCARARDGAHRQLREHSEHVGSAGWPSTAVQPEKGYSGFNAQLTLLGTLSGLVVGSIGAGILKGIGASSVLITASFVFIAATVASLRLQRPAKVVRDEVAGLTQSERDRNVLNPMGDIEVVWD